MAKVSQWLTSRSKLSDWLTGSETEKRSMASLRLQMPGYAAHPLPMGLEEVCMGMQQLGRDSFMLSRFSALDVSGEIPMDELATEDLIPLADEESGEGLALT